MSGCGIRFKVGPFNVQLQTKIEPLGNNIRQLYRDSTLLDETQFVDFHLSLTQPRHLRRFIRPQVNFIFDQARPFKPLPLDQACAFFEWGLNWAIAQHAMQYLIIHSAVLEKDGKAIILPGLPGAGKSTLCAALSYSGWRLLSDEQALICTQSGEVFPIARPICLKDESIEVIKAFCPSAEFGHIVRGTSKGDLAHIKPPLDAIAQIDETAQPNLIILPRYDKALTDTVLTSISRGAALVELIPHCFNYTTLGRLGFTTLKQTVQQSQCYKIRYKSLEQAIALINQLHEESTIADDPQ